MQKNPGISFLQVQPTSARQQTRDSMAMMSVVVKDDANAPSLEEFETFIAGRIDTNLDTSSPAAPLVYRRCSTSRLKRVRESEVYAGVLTRNDIAQSGNPLYSAARYVGDTNLTGGRWRRRRLSLCLSVSHHAVVRSLGRRRRCSLRRRAPRTAHPRTPLSLPVACSQSRALHTNKSTWST